MPLTMQGTRLRSHATNSWTLLLRLVFATILSSLMMGALATAFQYIRVVPLILDAEAFEVDELPDPSATSRAELDTEEWAPADGAERGAFTLCANFVITLGFSLFLIGLNVAGQHHVLASSGLQRGVAGWVIFMGLPCAGLSPELPGMAAAELTKRQWWWLYAVAFGALGFGIALLASIMPPPAKPASADSGAAVSRLTINAIRHNFRQFVILAVAVVVTTIPHLTGAPHPHTTGHDGQNIATATACGAAHVACERTGPPSEMAAAFAVWCLATAFAYWACLGFVCAHAYNLAMGFEVAIPRELSPTIELAESTTTTDAI